MDLYIFFRYPSEGEILFDKKRSYDLNTNLNFIWYNLSKEEKIMNVFGPNHSNRIEPIGDRPDDQEDEQKRRRRQVLFGGRTWGQKEGEELPVDRAAMSLPLPKEQEELALGVYADQTCLEQAQNMFDAITTLEEKVAQLCFYDTKALYDTKLQRDVELLIQAWQVGGILFTGGEYKRQAYLIEQFQTLSKTPLLVGNDFLHGLSFYYEDHNLPSFESGVSEQRFSDLGKAIMVLGRRINIHFQIDRESKAMHIPMAEHHIRAFRKGIRQAHGIVARTKPAKSTHKSTQSKSLLSMAQSPLSFSKDGAQEHIGVKSLNFLDLTEEKIDEKKMLHAFKEHYEIFLCSNNIQQVITIIAGAVRNGKIWEKHIDRLVMKLLVLKALYKR